MSRVLVTAFGPYDRWTENSSWLALQDLTHWYDGSIELITRRYPVDLNRMTDALRRDMASTYDAAIHLGQSPGASLIQLEAVGLNVRTDGEAIIPDAVDAHRSRLPLNQIAGRLCDAGIPAEVSHHAGTYLCNAAMFLSQHFAQHFETGTPSVFVHLPLTPAESSRHAAERLPSMSTPLASAAIGLMVDQFASAVA